MSLNDIYRAGLAEVWRRDEYSQNKFLGAISEIREMPVETFKKINAIFIPNDTYMREFFGLEITQSEYGCYVDDLCVWNNCLIIPITNIAKEVVGFVGFNPFNYLQVKESGDRSLAYYSYSTKKVFMKSNYIFTEEGEFTEAIKDGYIFIVDGVFDAVNVTEAGFHAGALMGSMVTEEILMQLRLVNKVILIADNDEAGYKLYARLSKSLQNVQLFKQGKTKDADELLKTEYRDEFIAQLRDAISEDYLTYIHASFSKSTCQN